MKAKKGFMDVYKKRYDTSKGFGSPDEWVGAFKARMGLKEAQSTLGDKDPLAALGLTSTATWDEVKKAYRAMAMKYHPDRNAGDEEAAKIFKEKQAAYEILEHRFGK